MLSGKFLKLNELNLGSVVFSANDTITSLIKEEAEHKHTVIDDEADY